MNFSKSKISNYQKKHVKAFLPVSQMHIHSVINMHTCTHAHKSYLSAQKHSSQSYSEIKIDDKMKRKAGNLELKKFPTWITCISYLLKIKWEKLFLSYLGIFVFCDAISRRWWSHASYSNGEKIWWKSFTFLCLWNYHWTTISSFKKHNL